MNQIRTSVLLILLAVLACVFYSMTHAQQPVVSLQSSTPLMYQAASQHGTHAAAQVHLAGSIIGPPTITASFIDHILDVAQSPAKGIGTVMYRLGTQYDIDPAYALAFFHHESDYGKAGMAISTHSIGNIRCTTGYPCDPSGGYRAYPSYAASVADWYTLIHDVYLANGLTTVQTIIPVYAPSTDHNDESAYIHSVLSDVAQYRQGEVER